MVLPGLDYLCVHTMQYDYNLTSGGSMAEQTVELKLQCGTATAHYATKVFGNARGLDVIEQAVRNLTEFLGYDDGVIRLDEPNGDAVECGLWDFALKDFVVEARILAIAPISFEEMTERPLSVVRIKTAPIVQARADADAQESSPCSGS